MELILNACLGAGLLLFLVLLFKKGKTNGDYFFLLWIATVLLQIAFYQITIYLFELEGILAVTGFALPLLGAPLLFLYITFLTGNSLTWRTVLLHLSVYLLYVTSFFVFQQYSGHILIADNGYLHLSEDAPVWFQYYAIPMAISGFVYCVWGLVLLKRHRKTIGDYFSFDEKINLKWVRYLVYSYFILFVIASFFIFGAIHFNLFKLENAFALVSVALSLMLITCGFYGFRQTEVFTNIISAKNEQDSTLDDSNASSTYAKSGLTDEKIASHSQRLTKYMLTEKPFFNEDLALPILAKQLDLPQAQLSQVINQNFKMNFYDFVNQYRVEESKKRLVSKDYDHLSILGIAFDCGFKSKSSFNRYFKKYTGVSPSEFKKNPIK